MASKVAFCLFSQEGNSSFIMWKVQGKCLNDANWNAKRCVTLNCRDVNAQKKKWKPQWLFYRHVLLIWIDFFVRVEKVEHEKRTKNHFPCTLEPKWKVSVWPEFLSCTRNRWGESRERWKLHKIINNRTDIIFTLRSLIYLENEKKTSFRIHRNIILCEAKHKTQMKCFMSHRRLVVFFLIL